MPDFSNSTQGGIYLVSNADICSTRNDGMLTARSLAAMVIANIENV